jgi:hypothetical protein
MSQTRMSLVFLLVKVPSRVPSVTLAAATGCDVDRKASRLCRCDSGRASCSFSAVHLCCNFPCPVMWPVHVAGLEMQQSKQGHGQNSNRAFSGHTSSAPGTAAPTYGAVAARHDWAREITAPERKALIIRLAQASGPLLVKCLSSTSSAA